MIYDLIIIGAGAAGLFAGASLPSPVNGLILEKKPSPGRKLLMSGSGQCNLTHGGNIKEFIEHYGEGGSKIRSVLYHFNNLRVMDFFEKNGISLFEREDGKVFPKSLRSQDVLEVLIERCRQNGLTFCYSTPVENISLEESPCSSPASSEGTSNNGFENRSGLFLVHCGSNLYKTKKLIIAAGGCSYPVTGSDGSLFPVLQSMGIAVSPLTPALVPIYVKNYPYQSLSGISFQNAEVAIHTAGGIQSPKTIFKNKDAVLFTHNGFSGPAILNLSRYAHVGDGLVIDYFPEKSAEIIHKELIKTFSGNSRQLLTVLYDYFKSGSQHTSAEMPKRFLESVCNKNNADPAMKSAGISGSKLKEIIKSIKQDGFRIEKLGGYETAMVTAGGVSLSEINMKTMESKRYPCLFFIGEVLDIDGDTGGYNLQFAFSSGHLAAQQIV